MEEPSDDKGGGAAVFDAPAKDGVGDGEPPGGDVTVPDKVVKDEPVVPAPTTVDAKQFAEQFGGVIAKEFSKVAKKDEPQLTPEEAKKLLNVWDPTPEWIAKFDNLETRNAAIAEMRDGLIKHADTISQHRLKELQSALEEKFAPALERIRQMDERAAEERFDKAFPQLAKPTLRPLIQAVAKNLADKGKKFDDEASMFAAIASGAEAVIKETNPDFKLTAGSSPAPKKNSNAIPVTTPGAGGGVASDKGAQPAPKKGLAIFGKG